jgi:galactosamine-6-phosphate isomerase
MKFFNCKDDEEMSEMAYRAVFADLKKFQNQLICAAAGNSVRGLYGKLALKSREAPRYFKNLGILKLDEWVGMERAHPSSCEYYLDKMLIGPLGITNDRYIGFLNNPDDTLKECERVDSAIEAWGGIGCCILGLGVNGHLGFNEPGDSLRPNSHMVRLSDNSRSHSMITSVVKKPQFGLTIGMRAILQARKIVLLLTGTGKRQVIESLYEQKITTHMPASFLWIHPDVICFRDMATTS